MTVFSEHRLLVRARVLLSLQLAGAITAVVLLVGGLAFMVTMNRQHTQIDDMLHYTLGQSRTGEVDPCTWLFIQRGDELIGASAAPPGLPLMAPIHRANASGSLVSTSMHANGTRYFLLTQRTDNGTRQAVFDARYQMSDRSELFTALVIAELIGLLIASVTGVLLARLAIAPLDEALSRQRRFVADASHELRTPLTRLYTRAQLLLRRDLPPGMGNELRSMVDSSRELNEIVDDLLRSASLTSAHPDATPVDLSQIATTVVNAEQPRAIQEGVTLSSPSGRAPEGLLPPGAVVGAVVGAGVDATPGAVTHAGAVAGPTAGADPGAAAGPTAGGRPAAGADPAAGAGPGPVATRRDPADEPRPRTEYLVAGVESALRRMVSALVDNALRHSSPGGDVMVIVTPAGRTRTVTLTVADNGTGLDPADSHRIFERFHRGTAEKTGSHGLGLALVREIVEAHGGTVTATGHPGRGTHFVVTLPSLKPTHSPHP